MPVAGLDSGLRYLLQRTFRKQWKACERGLNRDDAARGGRTARLGEGEGGARGGGGPGGREREGEG